MPTVQTNHVTGYLNSDIAYTIIQPESSTTNRLAILLPGMGYTTEAPLFRYTIGLLLEAGYGVVEVHYRYQDKKYAGSDIEEAVQLCGLDHQTLGASIVEGLANTELTENYNLAMQEARSKFTIADDAEMEKDGADLAKKEAEQVGYGGWLKQGSQSYQRLERKLTQDERCKYMLADALARFTAAEQGLRKLFA